MPYLRGRGYKRNGMTVARVGVRASTLGAKKRQTNVRRLRRAKGLGLGPMSARTQYVPKQLVSKPAGRFTALNGNMTNSICTHLAVRPRYVSKAMTKVSVSTILSDQYAIRVDGKYGFQAVSSYGFMTQQYLAKLPLYPATVPGVGTNLPYRINVQSVVGNVTLANACTAPVELEIYDIVLKRDLPLAVQWKQNANTWTVPQMYPDACWDIGSYANNATIPTGGSGPQANIAASPFDSTLFNAYFKVKKRTKVLLGQGGIHRHTVVSKVNKILDSVLFNQIANPSVTTPTSGELGWRSLTTFVMVVQKGLPVSDAEAATTVTTAETHVDVVQDFRIKWNYVTDNSYGVYNTDSLTSPATGQIINTGNGLAEAITSTV